MHPVVQPPTLATLYSSTAIATGGLLDGRVRTIDGQLDMELAKPRELGGSEERPGHDPCQLLAAAYSASFLASLLAARSQDGPQSRRMLRCGQLWDSGFAQMEVLDWRSHSRSSCLGSSE